MSDEEIRAQYESGREAGRREVVKWLNEPCKEHSFYLEDLNGTEVEFYEVHRYLCPECRKEIGLEG